MKGIMIAWIVAILIYIFNIVVIVISGASFISNIAGWVCCIILAITLILTEYYHEKIRKVEQETLELQVEILRKVLEAKCEIIQDLEKEGSK